MNILIYSRLSSYIDVPTGGAETSLRLIAEKLAERGHNVFYLTTDTGLKTLTHSHTINGVRIITFADLNSNCFLEDVGLRFKNQSFKYAFLRFVFAELIFRFNIQLVHTFYELDILKILIHLRERYNSFKIVMRMAGLYWYEDIKRNKLLIDDYKNVFEAIDCVNFISRGLESLVKQKEEELGIEFTYRRVMVGDIGVVINEYLSRSQNSKTDTFKILVATRFSNYQKRQDLIIEAVKLLKNKLDIQVTLIGSGVRATEMQHLINNYKLQKAIQIRPYLQQDELWNLMNSADLLCHPCEYEGLSKIIIESMMLGLPVLASNVLPMSDYIKDGFNGYLVDNTAAAWAHKIRNIYHHRSEISLTSANARQFIVDNYDSQKNVLLYETEFFQLIENEQTCINTESLKNIFNYNTQDMLHPLMGRIDFEKWTSVANKWFASEEYKYFIYNALIQSLAASQSNLLRIQKSFFYQLYSLIVSPLQVLIKRITHYYRNPML